MATVLKTLTDTAFDSLEGYRKAEAKADSPALKQAIAERTSRREQTVARLNAELQRRGEELVTRGTVSGQMHQVWLGVSDAFEDGDEAAAERIEEGEDYLRGRFEAALREDDLDAHERALLEQCYAEICEGERVGDMIDDEYD